VQVTVYSTTTCPYCKMLKTYLKDKGFEYTEKLVDQDDSAREEMMGKSGGYLGVPFTVISKDGEEISIIGFDKAKVNETLGITE
jgi:glutaredoxin 3